MFQVELARIIAMVYNQVTYLVLPKGVIPLTIIECGQFIGNEIVVTTGYGSRIHFGLCEIKYHDDGTQLIVRIIEATLPERVIMDSPGALVFAKLEGVAPDDVKSTEEVIPHTGTIIAPGYIGLLKIKDIDPWAFAVRDVEVL